MGYSVGAATSVSNLLSAIESFAFSEGWTIDSSKTARSDSPSNGECVNISKNGVCFGIFSDTRSILLYPSDLGFFIGLYTYPTYSSGNGNMVQASPSQYCYTNTFGVGGFTTHHLFGGPNHINIVVEATSGMFRHLGFGVVDKLGSVSNGAYIYGSRIHDTYRNDFTSTYHLHPLETNNSSAAMTLGSTQFRADCDGVSPKYFRSREYDIIDNSKLRIGYENTSSFGWLYPFNQQVPISELTGRNVLAPLLVQVDRGSGYFSPIGFIPDLRFISMNNYNPGDSIIFGSDTWRVFPIIRKNGILGEYNSGNRGFALLQRP